MTRSRLNRYLDWITITCAALALVIITAGMIRDAYLNVPGVFLWQLLAAFGFTLALTSLLRLRLYTSEENR